MIPRCPSCGLPHIHSTCAAAVSERVAELEAALAAAVAERQRDARGLTFAEVTEANVARCQRWHAGGLEDWSVTDWSNATAGELGEVCNAIKKLRRVEDGIANISDPGRLLASRDEAVAVIGEEIADTFLYLNLLACRLGINLADEVVRKFNATSERYGFPERLTAAAPTGQASEGAG